MPELPAAAQGMMVVFTPVGLGICVGAATGFQLVPVASVLEKMWLPSVQIA